SNIDVWGELVAAEKWLVKQSNWYPAASGLLGKRNREVGLRKAVMKEAGVDEAGEPEVVRQGRRSGLTVIRLERFLWKHPAVPEWRVEGEIYDANGKYAGF